LNSGVKSGLAAWLRRLEQRAPESRIELGLERVRRVYQRLSLTRPRAVVTVGGTNGKGSVVAYLEAMGQAAGLSTFAYTSPHLIDFSERFRIDGQPAPDDAIAAALEAVEQARQGIDLTYFEHATLAGWVLASGQEADLWVLEVGLGGRLDAVNVVDADVSIITSIGLDHTEWLGPTRLHVGREKAGIARPGRPLVLAEPRPPRGLNDVLEATGAELWRRGREFRSIRRQDRFLLRWGEQTLELPLPTMRGLWQQSNAAAAAMAAVLLAPRLRIDPAAMADGLLRARIAGRMEAVAEAPEVLLDVAHNPAAAQALAGELARSPVQPTIAVFAALRDKDIAAIGRALRGSFDHWFLAPINSERALSTPELASGLEQAAVTGPMDTLESIAEAIDQAIARAGPQGRVVVFGSFRTVAEAWPLFGPQ
jgi:dihydrofolate synthase/folylpolyglutamate synthase